MLTAPYSPSWLHQVEAAVDRRGEGLFLLQLSVTLFQVAHQTLRADKLPVTLTAHVQEEVLPDVSGEGLYLGCGMVTKETGEGTLGPVNQQVALTFQLILKASVAGGTVVEELSEALASL